MSELSITEARTVQFPMVAHVAEIGWTRLTPDDAKAKRGAEDAMFFRDDLSAKLREFNPWLNNDSLRQIVEKLEALRPSIEGNREMLQWLRGERSWYDEEEKRHRPVKAHRFRSARMQTCFHVTWEWKIKPPARKGNRADVMFADQRHTCRASWSTRIRRTAMRSIEVSCNSGRYEKETPELMAAAADIQCNPSAGLLVRRDLECHATRDDAMEGERRMKLIALQCSHFSSEQSFLRTLQQWILFYVEDDELRKSVLRQHQRRADRRESSIVVPTGEKARPRCGTRKGQGRLSRCSPRRGSLLEDKRRFANATVIVVVDRTELEGQLKGWVDRLLGEMQQLDIASRACRRARRIFKRLLDRGLPRP